MTRELENKVAVVTGASSGIGAATAIKMAEAGAKVVLAARRETEGQAVKEQITSSGGEAIFVQTDCSQENDIRNLIATAVETYGRIDIAFNNAGTLDDKVPTHEVTEDDWDRVLAVNLKGVWLCMKYEIQQMLSQGGDAAIVNDSSYGGLRGARNHSPYSASKHGMIGLTKSAALEYVQSGIRVNVVCPGFIDTEMTQSFYGDTEGRDRIAANHPAGRHGAPEEIADAVVWLCSDAASFVTGVAMPVDGGIMAR